MDAAVAAYRKRMRHDADGTGIGLDLAQDLAHEVAARHGVGGEDLFRLFVEIHGDDFRVSLKQA